MPNYGPWQITTWHHIDSEIEDRLVTYCGRQMTRRTKRGYLLLESDPVDACKVCR